MQYSLIFSRGQFAHFFCKIYNKVNNFTICISEISRRSEIGEQRPESKKDRRVFKIMSLALIHLFILVCFLVICHRKEQNSKN